MAPMHESETDFSATQTGPRKRVRSFVLREGRLTAGQRRALEELWPLFGIDSGADSIDLVAEFARAAPTTLEIGFGNGESLVAMARNAPDANFLGIEVHRPGVGHCLLRIEEYGLTNVRVICQDAVEVLTGRLPAGGLARVNLFFPDPWHKKRHHKRRIVQREFLRILAERLQPGGVFHVATDWPDYADHIEKSIAASPEFIAIPEAPNDRIETRFDKRGQKLGHVNWERAWCTRSKL